MLSWQPDSYQPELKLAFNVNTYSYIVDDKVCNDMFMREHNVSLMHTHSSVSLFITKFLRYLSGGPIDK